jgi:uncharacterized protein (DUF2237 family)
VTSSLAQADADRIVFGGFIHLDYHEARHASFYAPRLVLRATHEGALTHCKFADLTRLAVDLA